MILFLFFKTNQNKSPMDARATFLMGMSLMLSIFIYMAKKFSNRIKPPEKGQIVLFYLVGGVSSAYLAWMIVYVSQYRLMGGE